ncbi:MAG: 50S ribosomal protein L13 [Nitrospirota bacterium]|jgi:large subunit ribosomal protein L13
MKTQFVKKHEADRKWYVVDAEDKVLGRLASRIALHLRGKSKPTYTPHVDTGDFVVVVNAEKIKLTGNKVNDKIYYWHTGYPGGIRSASLREKLQKKPEDVIRQAVWGMLPKNRLGRAMFRKLKVYRGPEHPHRAQKPEPIQL